AALDDLLLELHVRDAVHEQPADAVVALEDGDQVADAVELRRAGEARGSGAHHRDLLPGPLGRRLGHDPAHLEALVDDRAFDVLDRDGRLVDAQDARAFARRGADAAGELREVVRLVEPLQRVAPLVAVDQVVPLGDQVVDRAARGHPAEQRAGVAEGDAAVHAARSLRAEPLLLHVEVELLPVRRPLLGVAVDGKLPLELHESGWLAHIRTRYWPRRARSAQSARFCGSDPSRSPFPYEFDSVLSVSSVANQLPPTRAASLAFISNAAISASSSVRPIARTLSSASSARLKSWG